jgi:YbbR domain-containing protein
MENKRYHIVIASIVFAVATWFSVNLRSEFTVVQRIPVVLANVKAGKALKYPVPKNITVHFRGTGWALAALLLSPDVTYYIDGSTLGPDNFTVTGRDLLEHIKLPVSLQVVEVKPETLLLALDEYIEKRVPVLPNISTDYREGYGQVGSIRVLPESVRIGGTRKIIESVTEWPTAYRKLENLRSSVDIELPLEDPPNYSIELFRMDVRLRINVQPFAEKTLAGIRVTASGVPPGKEVIFIPSRIDLIVRGGIEQLARVSGSDFQATIEFRSLVEDSAGTVVPGITAPPDVKVISRKPDRFQFIIRKRL